jgi:hypothetical protein
MAADSQLQAVKRRPRNARWDIAASRTIDGKENTVYCLIVRRMAWPGAATSISSPLRSLGPRKSPCPEVTGFEKLVVFSRQLACHFGREEVVVKVLDEFYGHNRAFCCRAFQT